MGFTKLCESFHAMPEPGQGPRPIFPIFWSRFLFLSRFRLRFHYCKGNVLHTNALFAHSYPGAHSYDTTVFHEDSVVFGTTLDLAGTGPQRSATSRKQ